MGIFSLHWDANTYIEYKKLSFRPINISLNVLRVYLSVQWHRSKSRPLKSLISSIFRSSKSKCSWHPWIFGALWTNPRKLYIPMHIPKCWRSSKHALRRSCPSLPSMMRTTNLHTSSVANDQWICERPFITFTRQRISSTLSSFITSFSHARCKRVTTYWTTSTMSR